MRLENEYRAFCDRKMAALQMDYPTEESRRGTPHYYTTAALLEAMLASLARETADSGDQLRKARQALLDANAIREAITS